MIESETTHSPAIWIIKFPRTRLAGSAPTLAPKPAGFARSRSQKMDVPRMEALSAICDKRSDVVRVQAFSFSRLTCSHLEKNHRRSAEGCIFFIGFGHELLTPFHALVSRGSLGWSLSWNDFVVLVFVLLASAHVRVTCTSLEEAVCRVQLRKSADNLIEYRLTYG